MNIYSQAYYVDAVSENDSNSGTTEEAAYKTITQALNNSLAAGDVVLIKPGIYRESLMISNGGTTDNPVIIKGSQF